MSSRATLLASSVPRIGVAVFILHPANTQGPAALPGSSFQFLMGKRLGSHGAQTWALPGGHLEFNESFEACAAREVLEETELEVEDMQFLTATNDVMPFENHASGTASRLASGDKEASKGLHYVTIFMTARVKPNPRNGADAKGLPVARLMEPHKCAGWEWVSWEDLERWAKAHIDTDAGGKTLPENHHDATSNSKADVRPLFSPMVDLFVQRPGVVPRIG